MLGGGRERKTKGVKNRQRERKEDRNKWDEDGGRGGKKGRNRNKWQDENEAATRDSSSSGGGGSSSRKGDRSRGSSSSSGMVGVHYFLEHITAIYTAHAPDKLAGVPALLAKHGARLPQLLEAIEKKYGVPRSTPPTPGDEEGAANNHLQHLPRELFVSWEELLGARQELKQRMDTIAAVHGWQGRCGERGFLGGMEPAALLRSIREDIAALEPSADALQEMDLVLQLRAKGAQLESLVDERDRLAEDMYQLREDCFEARDQLEEQTDELQRLRQQELERDLREGRMRGEGGQKRGGGRDGGGGGQNRGVAGAGEAESKPAAPSSTLASSPSFSAVGDLSLFKTVLAREQAAEGRGVVKALEQLKLPDEDSMGARELACWHENKKTIVNSLKTLSSQIYSTTTRILYEIIQNADDCSFEEEERGPGSEEEAAAAAAANSGSPPESGRALRELHLECSKDALVAFHNEKGFQAKDLYSMCQVGASSKAAGSGSIGRKGIGFKSVFQISDCPVVISPPFQFCFDTVKHDVFGYIVPSWVDTPAEHVPAQNHALLHRIFPGAGSGAGSAHTGAAAAAAPPVSATGTLLVCPMAKRVRGLDLMKDLSFDGLSLAFLKNLEQITFSSSVAPPTARSRAAAGSAPSPASSAAARLRSADAAGAGEGGDAAALGVRRQEHRVERSVVFERGGPGQEPVALGEAVLKGINVVSHRLLECTIIERSERAADGGNADGVGGGAATVTESHRHYRLHHYTIRKHKGGAPSSAPKSSPTTTISLAFPVSADQTPQRSSEGELVFAYLPVCAAGFGFAIHADFELVASREDVSDRHHGNHVLLGRIPPLFVVSVPVLCNNPLCGATLTFSLPPAPYQTPTARIAFRPGARRGCDFHVPSQCRGRAQGQQKRRRAEVEHACLRAPP